VGWHPSRLCADCRESLIPAGSGKSERALSGTRLSYQTGKREELQWSRTAIGDVAGRGGQFIWRGVLGLRLKSRPSTERVGGWKIADRGEDWIRLEASSWFLTAHLVTRLDDGHLFAGTFIRYDHPIAPLIWVPVSAVHRRLMPGRLVQTVRLRAGHSDGAVQRNHERAGSPEGGH
jgi:hypothetical protein